MYMGKKIFCASMVLLLLLGLLAFPTCADEIYPDRDVVFANEFDSTGEISSAYGFVSRSINDGIASVVPQSTDNGAYLSVPMVPAAEVGRIAISFRTSVSLSIRLYFIPDGTAIDEAKTFSFTNIQPSEDFQTVYIDTGVNANWKGNIKQYRLSFYGTAAVGQTIELDFVRFYSPTWPVNDDVLYPERQILYANEFASAAELGAWRDGYTSAAVADGCARFTYDKTPANYYYSNTFNFPAASSELIAFRIKSEKAINVVMYFMTSTEPNAGEDKRFSFSVPASEDWQLITLTPFTNAKWAGNITRYRLDLGRAEPNTVQIDFVRFYSAVLPSYTEDERRVSYDFSVNKDSDGFVGNEETSGAVAYNGELWVRVTGSNAYLTAVSSNYEARAEDIAQIRISYKNKTPGTEAKLYFTTEAAPLYSEAGAFSFPIQANSSGEYEIDTVENALWKGKITGLRFAPADAPGSVQIDFIRLEKFPCTLLAHNGVVSISGNLYGLAEKELSLIVQDAETEIEGYRGKTQTGADGTFSFSFDIPTAPPEPTLYNLLFDADELAGTYKKQVIYSPESYINGIVDEVNAAKTAGNTARAQEVIEENFELLCMQCAFYGEFAKTGLYMDELYAAFAASGDAADLADLERQLDEAVVQVRVNHMTADEWLDAVDDYNNYLNLKALPAYETYAKAGEPGKKAVAEKMSAGNYADFTAVQDAFQKQVVLVGLRRAVGWEDVKDILQTNAALIGVDLSAAGKLKNPSEAYRMLTEKNFSALADVKKAFDDAVSAQMKKENADSTNNTVGGGFSGSGGGASIVNAPQVVIDLPGQEDPAAFSFVDLDGFDWAKNAIETLYEKNIISGTGGRYFEPSREVTREEFVKMLVLSAELPLARKASFTDVAQDAWYAQYIGAAVDAGFARGQGDAFGIGQLLTRQDAAVMAARAFGVEGTAAGTDFSDYDDIADYAKDAVAFLAQMRFLKGYEDGAFRPAVSLSRAQAAVIIHRIIEGVEV